MSLLRVVARSLFWGGVALCFSLGCTLSRQVQITSEPPGAEVWLGNQRVGHTPVVVRAKATGYAGIYTFDPQYVTFTAPGYRREVRSLNYESSTRNLILSFPFIVPGVLWGKLPVALYVPLRPEE